MKYWHEIQEQKFVEYINETDDRLRSGIFDKYLNKPLQTMAGAVLYRYFFGCIDKDVINAGITNLIKNANHYRSDRAKAYSFCQTVFRNFFSSHLRTAKTFQELPKEYDPVDDSDNEYRERVEDLKQRFLHDLKKAYQSASQDIDKQLVKGVYYLVENNLYDNIRFNTYYLFKLMGISDPNRLRFKLKENGISGSFIG